MPEIQELKIKITRDLLCIKGFLTEELQFRFLNVQSRVVFDIKKGYIINLINLLF